MPLPTLPGVLRLSVAGAIAGGGRWQNTWHALLIAGGDWTDGAIDGFHDIFKQFYAGPDLGAGAGLINTLHPTTSVDSIAYTPLDGLSGSIVKSVSVVGVGTGASMPAEVAEVLTLRTTARGRQNRGRIFLPAMNTNNFDATGLIGAGTLSAILTQINQVATALATAGSRIAVGSYGPYKDPVTHLLVPGTPHATAVTSFSMDNKADVQRGRKS